MDDSALWNMNSFRSTLSLFARTWFASLAASLALAAISPRVSGEERVYRLADDPAFSQALASAKRLAKSDDGRLLALADGDRLTVWDQEQGLVGEAQNLPAPIATLAAMRRVDGEPWRVCFTGTDRRMHLWSAGEPRPKCFFISTPIPTCLAASVDGDRVAYGADDGFLRVFDLETRCIAWRKWGCGDAVAALPNGNVLVGSESSVAVLDAEGGAIQKLPVESPIVGSIRLGASGERGFAIHYNSISVVDLPAAKATAAIDLSRWTSTVGYRIDCIDAARDENSIAISSRLVPTIKQGDAAARPAGLICLVSRQRAEWELVFEQGADNRLISSLAIIDDGGAIAYAGAEGGGLLMLPRIPSE